MLKISDLQPMTPYKVTKQSSDHTFTEGEIIWVSENGDINSIQGSGWITPSECPKKTLDFVCVEAPDYEAFKIGNIETCKAKDLQIDLD